MKLKKAKIAKVLCGLFVICVTFAASSECCIYCGDCGYTPYVPTPTPAPVVAPEVCVFCGSDSSGSSGSAKSKTYANFAKAQTLSGQYYDDTGKTLGTATLKVGAISNKGTVKVSATLKSSKGKKYSASVTVIANASEGTASGTLPFSTKNIGSMRFELVYDDDSGMTFVGVSDNGYTMQSYAASGEYDPIDYDDTGVLGSVLSFSVDGGELEPPENYDFVTDVPTEEPVYVNSKGKWTCNKAPSIKYKKFKEDGETWYELVGLDDETRTNYSSLKLSYSAKKGTFSGSFKIYASNEGYTEKSPKLKSYTAKVSGQIVGSYGTGTARIKIGKNSYTLSVIIETVE